jgi:hypothetical protein
MGGEDVQGRCADLSQAPRNRRDRRKTLAVPKGEDEAAIVNLRHRLSWSNPSSRFAMRVVAAVASRGSRRDFIDVFALIRSGIPLVRMLELYQQKYGVHDVAHVLASLCYFDDAESETMPELLLPVSWDEVTSELGHSVRSVG